MTQRANLSLVKLKKGGARFEIVVDPDKALEFRQGKLLDMKEALKDIHVYTDAQKGQRPSADQLRAAFGTDDQNEAAKIILVKGDLQLTTGQRNAMHEAKVRQVLDLIHMWGIDPRNKTPHPVARLEAAFEEAKIKIDDSKTPQEQVPEIIKKLTPLLPIKIETLQIEVTLPSKYASKGYGSVKKLATIKHEQWLADGSWRGVVEIPGGMKGDFIETFNKITHGELIAKEVER